MKIKNAAIIGLGAIGCTVYPGLVKALGENHVYVIANGERKQRLQKNGVTINEKHYRLNVAEEQLSDSVDLMIFAVKFYQLEDAIKDAGHFVGRNTILLSLMNGIVSEEMIGEAYGYEHLLYCVSQINGIYKNGKATFEKSDKGLTLGVKDNEAIVDLIALENVLEAGDISFVQSVDVLHDMWYKFLLNASGNSVSAVLQADCLYFQKLESINHARMCIMKEILKLSQVMGTGLTDDDVESLKDYYLAYPLTSKCSTLQDVLAGRQTENEMFCGTIVKLGKKYGVDTPASELLYYLLKTIDDKNQGLLEDE